MGPALFAITLEAMKSDIDEVALQGIEFWSNVCDEEINLMLEQKEADEMGRPPERVSRFYAKGKSRYILEHVTARYPHVSTMGVIMCSKRKLDMSKFFLDRSNFCVEKKSTCPKKIGREFKMCQIKHFARDRGQRTYNWDTAGQNFLDSLDPISSHFLELKYSEKCMILRQVLTPIDLEYFRRPPVHRAPPDANAGQAGGI